VRLRSHLLAVLAAASTLVVRPVPAVAQSLVIRWNDGLTIESPDQDNKLQLGALVQADGRFAPDDPLHAVTDTFLMRRVRLIVQGRAWRFFEFRIMPDFAGSAVVLFDAYLDTKFSNAFRMRVGKDKTPIGLEQLYADYSLLFPERTLATNLVPNRDVGVQAQGSVAHGVLSYIAGVFNGVPDGTNGDLDSNSAKDLVGRATLRLGALGLAVAGSTGDQAGELPSFRTTAQQVFYTYAPGVRADGNRTRVSPSAFFYRKWLGAFAEYVRSSQAVGHGGEAVDVVNRAWEATFSFVVTGENATDRGVTPARPFNPDQHQWGALQIAARTSSLTVDPRAFAAGLAGSHANQQADAVGVAVIWYATRHVKHVISYERTVFDRDPNGLRRPEHAVVFRAQLNLQPVL
jgi:phosphate-selective porin OprO/OprP